jgi:hypothetical protein
MSTPTDTQTEVGFPSPYDQAIPPCLQQSAPALDWGLDTPAAKARVEEIQEATRFWVDSLLSATQPLHMKKIVLRWLGDHATAVAELPGIIPGLMRVQAQHRMQGSVADLLKKLDRVKRQVEAARAKLDADIADDEDPDAPAHPAVVAVMAEVPGNRQLPPQLSWRGPRLTSGATTVAMLPIVLSGRARDVHTGACTTRLTWATDRMGATTSRWIPASQATSARGLHALTDAGAPCPEASAGALGVALEAMRTSWDLPEQATSSKCGHVTVGDGRAFCLGDTVVAAGDAPPIVMQPPDGHVTLMASIRQSGDLETWMGAWATAARSPLARCIVYAALASPLLPWTSKAGAVIDLHGRTTQGKTTVLLLAASLFASP